MLQSLHSLFKKTVKCEPTTANGYVFFLGIIALAIVGCDNSALNTLNATIIVPPTDVEIEKGESVFFEGHASGGTPPYKFVWHFDRGASDCALQKTGEVIFNYEGAYMTSLTVRDSQGATVSDFVRIIISGESD